MNGIRYRQWDGCRWVYWGHINVEGQFLLPYMDDIECTLKYESFQSTGFYDSTRTKEFPEGKEIWDQTILAIGHPGYSKNYTVEQAGPSMSTPFEQTGAWIIKREGGMYDKAHLSMILQFCSPPAAIGDAIVIGDTMQNPNLMEVKK